MRTFVTFILFLCVNLYHTLAISPNRPRGVSISMSAFYQYNDADPYFHCLDKSSKVPFDYINDEYCDCADGSDEPGTSACSHGRYHCTNAGHIPLNIPSSRVNDGICDCCDGTDEYDDVIKCSNTCRELGRLAREEAERKRKQVEEGHKLKISYSEEGKKAVEEQRAMLATYEQELASAKSEREKAEAIKNEAEIPEKAAKEVHDKALQEQREKQEKEADVTRADEAFRELDLNKDGLLDNTELMVRNEFDIDNNGLVSEEEANEYMSDTTEATMEHFAAKMWPGMKDIYKPLKKSDSEAAPDLNSKNTEELNKKGDDAVNEMDKETHESDKDDIHSDLEADDDKENEKDDDKDEADRADYSEDDDYKPSDEEVKEDHNPVKEEPDSSDYDEDTQKLISVANEARSVFNAADEKVKSLEQSISATNQFINLDLGPDKEFFPIKDKCFELDEAEYTYIFCPFSKAHQRPKSGSGETLLGTWGSWTGPDHDRYAVMLYENGLGCWNGPSRSVHVNMQCGLENKLVYAHEPNRCQYKFTFTTPARCSPVGSTPPLQHDHTEL